MKWQLPHVPLRLPSPCQVWGVLAGGGLGRGLGPAAGHGARGRRRALGAAARAAARALPVQVHRGRALDLLRRPPHLCGARPPTRAGSWGSRGLHELELTFYPFLLPQKAHSMVFQFPGSHNHSLAELHGLLGSALLQVSRAGEHGSRLVARVAAPLRPTVGALAQDGETLNNYVEVAGDCSDPGAVAARARLLSDEALLTAGERAFLAQHFGVRS